MLVLNRNSNQSIIINDNVKITVLGILNNNVRLGFEAPKEVKIDREEVHKKKLDEAKKVLDFTLTPAIAQGELSS